MLFLFPSWGHYWSWPTVTNPIPFSQACGQRSSVIWSDPQVYSEPWMDLSVVVLVGFWTILSPTWLCGSNLRRTASSELLMKPFPDSSFFFFFFLPNGKKKKKKKILTKGQMMHVCKHPGTLIQTHEYSHSHSFQSQLSTQTVIWRFFMLVRNLTSAHGPYPTSS